MVFLMKNFKEYVYTSGETEDYTTTMLIDNYIKNNDNSVGWDYDIVKAISEEDVEKIKELSFYKVVDLDSFIKLSDGNIGIDEELTPLMIASSMKKTKSIRALVRCGVDVNTKDNIGNNALSMVAMESNGIKAMEELISHGIDINVVNLNGDSIVGLAFDGKHYKETEFLLKNGAKVFYVEIASFEQKLDKKIIDMIYDTNQIVDLDNWKGRNDLKNT